MLSYIPYHEYIFQAYKYKSQFIYISMIVLVILCCLCHLHYTFFNQKMKWKFDNFKNIDNTLTNNLLLPILFWCIYGIVMITYIEPIVNYCLNDIFKSKIILINTLIQSIIFWISAVIIINHISNKLIKKIHFIFFIFFICLFTVNSCAPPYKIINKKEGYLKINFKGGEIH